MKMFEVIEGSVEQVTEEMKQMKAEYRLTVKALKAEIKKSKARLRIAEKSGSKTSHLYTHLASVSRDLSNLENTGVGYLTPSTIVPVELEGHYYNVKTIEELGRKLKGFAITIDVDHLGMIFIAYKKKGNKGCMKLYPLSHGYGYNLKHIPKVKALHTIASGEPFYRGAMQ